MINQNIIKYKMEDQKYFKFKVDKNYNLLEYIDRVDTLEEYKKDVVQIPTFSLRNEHFKLIFKDVCLPNDKGVYIEDFNRLISENYFNDSQAFYKTVDGSKILKSFFCCLS